MSPGGALWLEPVTAATSATLLGLALGTVPGGALYATRSDGGGVTQPVVRSARRVDRLPILDAIASARK